MNLKLKSLMVCLLLASLIDIPETLAQQAPNGKTENAQKQKVVRVKPGIVKPVYVSQKMTNEIVTPFEDPLIIYDEQTGSSVNKNRNIIYVDMDPNGDFLQLLIRDRSNDGPSINLFLMPQTDILGNAVTLEVEGVQSKSDAENHQTYTNMAYVDMLKELMRDAVLDRVGSGFTKDSSWLDGVPFQIGNLMVRPTSIWKSGKLNIEKWTVINTSDQNVTLTEENFYQEGVRGVSFYPSLMLSVNEATTLFRIVDKPAKKAGE